MSETQQNRGFRCVTREPVTRSRRPKATISEPSSVFSKVFTQTLYTHIHHLSTDWTYIVHQRFKGAFSATPEKTALSLDGAFQPIGTPLEDPVPHREESQSPLRPTGQDPCLRLFPGDDFIGILAIFFKTPVEFIQLLLSDGDFVGIGR